MESDAITIIASLGARSVFPGFRYPLGERSVSDIDLILPVENAKHFPCGGFSGKSRIHLFSPVLDHFVAHAFRFRMAQFSIRLCDRALNLMQFG